MSKKTILEVPLRNFDFSGFIEEVSYNFEQYIESDFICLYMCESDKEKDVYLDLFRNEVEPKIERETYEEDLMENDRILYVRFLMNIYKVEEEGLDMYDEAKGYLCGDGHHELQDNREVDFGEFTNFDNGFIIKSEGGILKFGVGGYAKANMHEEVIVAVDNPGEFEQRMKNFARAFII